LAESRVVGVAPADAGSVDASPARRGAAKYVELVEKIMKSDQA
jgi:hypothetical protein